MDNRAPAIAERPGPESALPSAPTDTPPVVEPLYAILAAGALATLVGATTPWFHLTVPLLGTVTWTGLDFCGWVLPLLAVGTLACATLDAFGRGNRLVRHAGMACAAAAVLFIGAELAIAIRQLASLEDLRHSHDAWIAAEAQLTTAAIDPGFFLSLAASMLAAIAAAVACIGNRRVASRPAQHASPPSPRHVQPSAAEVAYYRRAFGLDDTEPPPSASTATGQGGG